LLRGCGTVSVLPPYIRRGETRVERIFRKLDRLIVGVLDVAIVLLVVLTFGQVILRYFFDSPLTWVEEFLGVIMTFFILIGAAWGVRHSIHISLELFVQKLFRGNMFVPTLIELVLFAFSGILLIIYGKELADLTRSQVLPATSIPVCYVYMAIPISGVAMFCFSLERIGLLLTGRDTEDDGDPDAKSRSYGRDGAR